MCVTFTPSENQKILSNHGKSGAVCGHLGGREIERVERVFWILLEDPWDGSPDRLMRVELLVTWLGAFVAPTFLGCP